MIVASLLASNGKGYRTSVHINYGELLVSWISTHIDTFLVIMDTIHSCSNFLRISTVFSTMTTDKCGFRNSYNSMCKQKISDFSAKCAEVIFSDKNGSVVLFCV